MSDPFSAPVSRTEIVERIRSIDLGDDPAAMRRHFARLVGEGDPPPPAPGAPGTIVYCHGGGYVFGSPRTHARIARGLAERTCWSVVVPDYPLAPEAPWPAARDFVLGLLDAIDGPVVLAGGSAGGHLALVCALRRAKEKRPVTGLVLFSPNTDRSGLSQTRERNDPIDPMVDEESDRHLAAMTFGEDFDPHDVEVSPLLDDLALLPPLYVEVGAEEVLLDDSRLLAARAKDRGASVTLHVEPDGLHMGQIWSPWWDVAEASLDRSSSFVRSVTAPT